MKILAKALRIFSFKTYRGTLQHMRFCKDHAIDQREGTRTITGTELNNKMKYREEIDNAYNELMHWKRNLFDPRKGTPGKNFISELTKLINRWSSKSPNRDICIKALMVMPSLILQRISNKCKTSKIKSHVDRRLNLWKNKDVEGLLNETRTIQKRLPQLQNYKEQKKKLKYLLNLFLKER